MAKVKNDSDQLKLSAQIGYKCLEDDVSLFGEDNKFTQLVWPLSGEDPDEAFSGIPYEKGFNLLYYLENLVGSTQFEAFAKSYLNEYKFKTVSSGEFKEFFLGCFGSLPVVKSLNWSKLFYERGLPDYAPDFCNPLSKSAVSLAERWIQCAKNSEVCLDFCQSDLDGWSSQQKCVFLETLLKQSQNIEPFSLETLSSLDLAYQFTVCNNAELKYRWQTLCLLSEAEWIVPHVVSFITTQGRMKFVRPLYRSLHNSRVGVKVARNTFENNHEMYHPIAKKMIALDLGVNVAELSDESSGVKTNVDNALSPNCKADNSSAEGSTLFSHIALASVACVVCVIAFNLLKKR